MPRKERSSQFIYFIKIPWLFKTIYNNCLFLLRIRLNTMTKYLETCKRSEIPWKQLRITQKILSQQIKRIHSLKKIRSSLQFSHKVPNKISILFKETAIREHLQLCGITKLQSIFRNLKVLGFNSDVHQGKYLKNTKRIQMTKMSVMNDPQKMQVLLILGNSMQVLQ